MNNQKVVIYFAVIFTGFLTIFFLIGAKTKEKKCVHPNPVIESNVNYVIPDTIRHIEYGEEKIVIYKK
jgi:hypothetical protein